MLAVKITLLALTRMYLGNQSENGVKTTKDRYTLWQDFTNFGRQMAKKTALCFSPAFANCGH